MTQDQADQAAKSLPCCPLSLPGWPSCLRPTTFSPLSISSDCQLLPQGEGKAALAVSHTYQWNKNEEFLTWTYPLNPGRIWCHKRTTWRCSTRRCQRSAGSLLCRQRRDQGWRRRTHWRKRWRRRTRWRSRDGRQAAVSAWPTSTPGQVDSALETETYSVLSTSRVPQLTRAWSKWVGEPD